MDIYFKTPYSIDKNLGAAYNQAMRELPNDDDWCAIMDYDTMFLHPFFAKQISDIIHKYPDTGMFTCVTNRTGNIRQRFAGIISENGDIRHHRRIAEKLYNQSYLHINELNRTISGYLMVIQKKTWNKIKFRERQDSTNILGVDIDFGKSLLAAGKKIILMKGVYIFHYYRLLEGKKSKIHLK